MSNWKKIVVSGSQAHISSVTASNGSIISGSLTISGSINNPDNLDFNTTPPQSLSSTVAGRLSWDNGTRDLVIGAGNNVDIHVGQQEWAYVYNAEATTLTKGEIVYISGSQGNTIAVKRASDINDPNSAGTLGMVGESITSGAEGLVLVNGLMRKLDTSTLTAGSLLYLSSTPGAYTQTIPTPPSHSVRIGYVAKVDATQGEIYIKVDNGYEIGELHDIIDGTTTTSYGDLLVKSGSVWKNSKQLTGSYGLTGSLQATSFTGSLQGSASYAIQSLSASFATTASYVLGGGGGGGVTIGGPTSTDWSQYAGTPNRYMLVSDGVTNDITASHLIQLDTSNESINIYAGIEGYNDASITLQSNTTISAGNFYANSAGAGAGNFYGTSSYATSAATASSVGTLRQNITVSGSMFFSGSLNNPVFVDYEEKYTTISPAGGNLTVNLSDGNIFLVNLNDTVSAMTISNPPKNVNVGNFTLIVNQIGVYSFAWPSSVTWSNGNTAPSLDGDAIDFFTFVSYNSGSNWYGFVGGQQYPKP